MSITRNWEAGRGGEWHRNRKFGAHWSARLTELKFSVFIEAPCLKTAFQWKGVQGAEHRGERQGRWGWS